MTRTKKDKKNDEKKKKKKFIKKKRNGQAYFVEWDSDASSDDDEMTSHPRELPGSPSRRLHRSSPHHIVLWQKVVQRYYKMMNLKNFHMLIL